MPTATGPSDDLTATSPAPDPAGAPRRRRGRDVVIVAVGLAAGLGVSVFAGDVRDLVRGDAAPAPAAAPLRPSVEEFADVEPVSAEATPSSPAASPSAAVEQFLAAEREGDHARSFALLGSDGRATYRSPAAWRASHANFFPITGFEVRGVNDAGQRPEVVTGVRYRSGIDEVIGLVPASAEVTWPVVEEDGGWLVDFDGAQIFPELPADDGAADATRRWALARQGCEEAEEYSAGLVGAATLADELCDAEGRLELGAVSPLEVDDSAALVSAFGAAATSWARTVRISAPVPMTVVLAPVADRWLVVGVIAPR